VEICRFSLAFPTTCMAHFQPTSQIDTSTERKHERLGGRVTLVFVWFKALTPRISTRHLINFVQAGQWRLLVEGIAFSTCVFNHLTELLPPAISRIGVDRYKSGPAKSHIGR